MTARARTTTGDGFVTWGMLDRVLGLALKPLEDKLDDVSADVKLLLADKDQRTGAAGERIRWIESRRAVVGALVTLTCGLVGAVATLVWLAVTG